MPATVRLGTCAAQIARLPMTSDVMQRILEYNVADFTGSYHHGLSTTTNECESRRASIAASYRRYHSKNRCTCTQI